MRQLIYVSSFTGWATPTAQDGNALALTATAPGVTLVPLQVQGDPTANLDPEPGAEAAFASEVTVTGETSYLEIGTIRFGNGHRVRFATVGNGYIIPGPTGRHGAAIWLVEGGDGQFAGVRGLITAHLILRPDFTITGYHLGVLVLR